MGYQHLSQSRLIEWRLLVCQGRDLASIIINTQNFMPEFCHAGSVNCPEIARAYYRKSHRHPDLADVKLDTNLEIERPRVLERLRRPWDTMESAVNRESARLCA